MSHYEIQRFAPRSAKPGMDGWTQAWGLKPRTWPTANNDPEAIAVFERESKRCTTPLRLIKWIGGLGYSSAIAVIVTNGIEPSRV